MSFKIEWTMPLKSRASVGERAIITPPPDRACIGSAFLNPETVNGEPVAFEPGVPRALTVGVSLGAGHPLAAP